MLIIIEVLQRRAYYDYPLGVEFHSMEKAGSTYAGGMVDGSVAGSVDPRGGRDMHMLVAVIPFACVRVAS